jgi:hypothetical protein
MLSNGAGDRVEFDRAAEDTDSTASLFIPRFLPVRQLAVSKLTMDNVLKVNQLWRLYPES